MLAPKIPQEFEKLMHQECAFLTSSWLSARKEKYHRSEIKPVNVIAFVKDSVLNRLGVLPVFFFLVVVFGEHEYAGPYNHVEKGLLILYFLLSGSSIADMSRFIPRSSFYALYRDFFRKSHDRLNGLLDGCLTGMFSTTRIRILCAQLRNPKGLKHVTLLLDGHDSRASYVRGHDSARSYSYKLKKSGLRMQACIDINQMIVLVSDAEHCGEHNDGLMLSRIDLSHAVSKYDVIGLDGAYTLYIGRIAQKNTYLTERNFVCPIRKDRGKNLLAEEVQFNNIFGGFRSMIESVFGEIGHVFERFNKRNVIRVSDMETFTLQFKLASVLLNIKRFVWLGKLEPASHHTLWIQQGLDFGSSQDPVFEAVDTSVSLEGIDPLRKLFSPRRPPELPLNTVIRCVRQVVLLLEESTVILHEIDIAVDCAFISTRAIIKEYLMTLGVTDRDIADDVKDVGLNSISWRGYTTSVPPIMLRTKIYNKFVQMHESTDVRTKVGSQLANLIMNPCSRLTEKLRSFMASGMSRIEITFYLSTVYDAEEY
ncbi:hypothetical protein VTP01DRAFT_1665 [Rhizomucor pusillus]|uniref:uncharacterized protein n=1 Tax=Rhizomucor pusillus TaxID=4840 RepID=UPI00374274B6